MKEWLTVPQIIERELHEDARGRVEFFPSFDPGQTRRIYAIEHKDTTVIRAWQAHRMENKWFHVTAGRFLIAWVRIDDWNSPSEQLIPEYMELDARTPQFLFIPGGFANGMKALLPDSRIMIFSNLGVTESKADIVRYPSDRWLDWYTLRPKVKDGEGY